MVTRAATVRERFFTDGGNRFFTGAVLLVARFCLRGGLRQCGDRLLEGG